MSSPLQKMSGPINDSFLCPGSDPQVFHTRPRISMPPRWWRTWSHFPTTKEELGFFFFFFRWRHFVLLQQKKITPRIMTANWNAKIKKARMAPKWAIIDNVKDILRETSRPKVSQPVWVKAFWRREMITVRLTAVDDGWWAIFLRGKPRCWVTQSKNFLTWL